MIWTQRREFITLIGGAAAAWPVAVHAQQDLIRRIGVLIALAESDPEAQARVAALRQALQELGWIEGRNIRIDYRFAGGDGDRLRAYAEELVAAKPDVIFAGSGTALRRCSAPPARFRSFLLRSAIQWVAASSQAWRGPAATSPVLPNSRSRWRGNGWNS
jgi:nucleotide-binding universal stress UspA family protein